MAETSLEKLKTIDWRTAGLSGLIAGIIFLVLEMIMVPLFAGGSPWAPPRMMAAVVMGRGVLPPPATFAVDVFITALAVHGILSIVFGMIVALVVEYFGAEMGPAALVGAAFGLALYVVNFYGFTTIFPWFANARTWITIFAHIVFGLAAAWAYVELKQPTIPEVQMT